MSYNTEMAVCAKELFGFDWTKFYERHGLVVGTDTITSSTWTITNGTNGNEFVDGVNTSVIISPDSVGVDVLAKNVVEINGGAYRDCRTIRIRVTE